MSSVLSQQMWTWWDGTIISTSSSTRTLTADTKTHSWAAFIPTARGRTCNGMLGKRKARPPWSCMIQQWQNMRDVSCVQKDQRTLPHSICIYSNNSFVVLLLNMHTYYVDAYCWRWILVCTVVWSTPDVEWLQVTGVSRVSCIRCRCKRVACALGTYSIYVRTYLMDKGPSKAQ